MMMDLTDDQVDNAEYEQWCNKIHTDRYNFFNEELQKLKLGFEVRLEYIECTVKHIDEKLNTIFEQIKYTTELLELQLHEENSNSSNTEDN